MEFVNYIYFNYIIYSFIFIYISLISILFPLLTSIPLFYLHPVFYYMKFYLFLLVFFFSQSIAAPKIVFGLQGGVRWDLYLNW
jgi:hypothetical protein